MSSQKIRIGVNRYDHVQALFDGRVSVAGFETRCEDAPIVTDIFARTFDGNHYDVSELGLTFYLRALERGDDRFVALPIFTNRHFRHSSIWVNVESGIKEPVDLAGKRIGELAIYGHDAGIWPKGILSDEFGYKAEDSTWLIGAPDWPMGEMPWAPLKVPARVDARYVEHGQLLGPMLEAGEIDALISAVVPRCVLNRSPRVTTLFADPEAEERDYYRRTGIFPIMHTVVVRREFLDQHPGVPQALLTAFSESADLALAHYEHGRTDHHMNWMLPWMSPVHEKNTDLLAADHWKHGMSNNRTTIDTFLRYAFEQGITDTRFEVEELFLAELLET
jgi:4,5-dihydroxyphthalate decarboxylase